MDPTEERGASRERPPTIYRVRRRRSGAVVVLIAALLVIGFTVASRLGDGDGSGESASAPGGGEPDEKDGEGRSAAPPVRRIETLKVGRGAQAAVIVRLAGTSGPAPGVVLMHGWALGPAEYGAWARHLARGRSTVILPEYQVAGVTSPSEALQNTVAGVRAALRRVPVMPDKLVVAGHSAGAALAADYAAVAGREGLPAPRAIFAVYPGRAIRGYAGGVPTADLGGIPPDTRLVALASATDTVVGQTPARELVEAATQIDRAQRSVQVVDRPGAGDHFAPTRSDPAARSAFWRPLDRLIAEVSR